MAVIEFCGTHSTDVGVGFQLANGETLLQERNTTGHRWEINPGPCNWAQIFADELRSLQVDSGPCRYHDYRLLMHFSYYCFRLSDLLLAGAVMGRSFQPHEAHIPYMLQV